MIVQIPRGVDWAQTYCRPTTHKKPKAKKYQDLNAYFLSSLANKGGSTTFHSETLRTLFGSDYRRFVERLIENNVISVKSYFTGGNVVESYSVGESAKEYRLIDVYGFENYTISEPSTIRKIKKARVKQLRFTLATHPHLRREYDFIAGLSFDIHKATEFLQEEYKPQEMFRAVRYALNKYGTDWGRLLLKAYRDSDRRAIKGLTRKLNLTGRERERFRVVAENYRALKSRLHEAEKWNLIQTSENKEEYITISYSRRTNRVHTNLTNTPKNLRGFLRKDGEPLTEIDASNCQWALLVSYERFNLNRATNSINKGIDKKLSSFKETNKGGGGLWNPTTTNTPYPLLSHVLGEYRTMVDQLESGYFRDTLHSVACSVGRNLNQGAQRTTAYRIPQSDKKTKHLLLSRVLFDKPDAPYLNDEVVVIAFKKLYPNVYQRIQSLKSAYWREVSAGVDVQGKPYASLAILLQRAESEIFHTLFGEIEIEHGVIHDCILVPESRAEQMAKAMRQIAREYSLTLPLTKGGSLFV
jgi:hypothetical protein